LTTHDDRAVALATIASILLANQTQPTSIGLGLSLNETTIKQGIATAQRILSAAEHHIADQAKSDPDADLTWEELGK